jgi:hypothetical protein
MQPTRNLYHAIFFKIMKDIAGKCENNEKIVKNLEYSFFSRLEVTFYLAD